MGAKVDEQKRTYTTQRELDRQREKERKSERVEGGDRGG